MSILKRQMRQRPERKASNGKYAKSKKNHDESAGLSDHFPVYDDDSSGKTRSSQDISLTGQVQYQKSC